MANLGSYEKEAASAETMVKQVQSFKFGKATLAELATRCPEMLGHLSTKRQGREFSKVVSAYVSILKAVRKLQEGVDELPLEFREHFTMQPTPSQADEPSALVPFKSKSKKSNVRLANAMDAEDETAAPSLSCAVSVPSTVVTIKDIVGYHRRHAAYLLRVFWLLVKYVPVLLLYGLFVMAFFGCLVLGMKPELLVDLVFMGLTWLPEYVTYTFSRVINRAGDRLSVGISGDYNGTIAYPVNTPDSSGSYALMLLIGVGILWRAPGAPQ